jgi:predicted RNase H-like HicB family nuclease
MTNIINEENLQAVAQEVREALGRAVSQGKTLSEAREAIEDLLDSTLLVLSGEIIPAVMTYGIEAIVAVVYSIEQSLGGVNLVMVEHNLETFALKDIPSARNLVEQIEDEFEMGYEEIIEHYVNDVWVDGE